MTLYERIEQAVGMFLGLPYQFFRTPLLADWNSPTNWNELILVPTIGEISLIVGILLMLWHRHWALMIFLIPVAICQVFVTVAGFMRGDLSGAVLDTILYTFFGMQLLIIGYLIYLAKGTRLAATFLAIFCVTYALAAYLFGLMSFSDTWL